MSKQCLDVQQMQHLQELGLGLELRETLLYWVRCVDNDHRLRSFNYGRWYLQKGNKAQVVGLSHWEFIPAYNLQDVLELLPKEIKPAEKCYWLRIDLADECIYYYRDAIDLTERRGKVFSYYGEELIDAAYNALCWCIENGYVETNKTNEV